MSADTIIPDRFNPQNLNRYSYVINNPLKYTDPTGHAQSCEDGDICWSPTTTSTSSTGNGNGQGGNNHDDDEDDDPDPTNGVIIVPLPAVPTTTTSPETPTTTTSPIVNATPPTPDWGEWFAGGLELDAGVLTITMGLLTLATLFTGEHAVGVAAAPATFGLSEVMAVIHTPAVIGLGGSIMAVGVGFVNAGRKHMWRSGVLQWGYGKISTPFK